MRALSTRLLVPGVVTAHAPSMARCCDVAAIHRATCLGLPITITDENS